MDHTASTYLFAIVALVMTCITGCDDNLDAIHDMQTSSHQPIGEVKEMQLKYTDSGKIQATLGGPKMLDYTNDEFPFIEFPDGVRVVLFNHGAGQTQRTYISADYGVQYDQTGIVDLRGTVRVTDKQGTTFKGEQLYWDLTEEWVFSDVAFTTQMKKGTVNGNRFDSDQNFEKARVRKTKDRFKANSIKDE